LFGYRGILPDEYLEDDIEADRLTHWRCRLSAPTERDVGVLALEQGAPVGFRFAVRDAAILTRGGRVNVTAP
jgi:hypothetical protein